MDEKIFCFPYKSCEDKFFKEQDKYIKLIKEKMDDEIIEKLKKDKFCHIFLDDDMMFTLYYCVGEII